jgi:hypothetical protein
VYVVVRVERSEDERELLWELAEWSSLGAVIVVAVLPD